MKLLVTTPKSPSHCIPAVLLTMLLIVTGFSISISYASEGHASNPSSKEAYPWQLELTDANGDNFNLSDYHGKTLLLSFFFTTCGDTCPMQTARLAQVQKKLELNTLKETRFVSVSIDPETDTPAAIKHFLHHFTVDQQHWQFATPGSSEVLIPLLEKVGVKAIPSIDSDNIDHTMKIMLIDPAGKIMQRYVGHQFDIQRVANELKTMVRLRARS